MPKTTVDEVIKAECAKYGPCGLDEALEISDGDPSDRYMAAPVLAAEIDRLRGKLRDIAKHCADPMMTAYPSRTFQMLRGIAARAAGDEQMPDLSGAFIVRESVEDRIRALSDEQRVELAATFCRHCGTLDPRCQCWNDE